MPAYLIGRVDLRDPGYIAEYRSKTLPLIEKYGGQTALDRIRDTGGRKKRSALTN